MHTRAGLGQTQGFIGRRGRTHRRFEDEIQLLGHFEGDGGLAMVAGPNDREQSVRRLAQEHSAVSAAKPKLIQPTHRRAQSRAAHRPDRHADIG
jgi:hypothetical protein